jgi:hypothetical protein
VDILPNIVAALVIGGVGWIVATVLRNLVTNLLRSAGFDQIGNKAGPGRHGAAVGLAGLLVFIVVFVPALIAALDALKIEAISRPATDMLAMLLDAVPRIIAAGLILLVTWLVASFAARLLASLLANVGFDSLPASGWACSRPSRARRRRGWSAASPCCSPCCSPPWRPATSWAFTASAT